MSFDVRSEYDVSTVIAGAQRFCAEHGASPVFSAHVATAASELANNLWLYAERGGRLRLTLLQQGAHKGIELVSEDDGPGIADPALAMTEGWSSGGGMGCGLPGVQRLMDEFDLQTGQGRGTRVVARKWWPPLH
ncbi:ATP-binding protein [Rubrivivax gelatinosus]|uniref:ATP-binding protein n=1 Tax=Rubrivivax gelatinosus TaxID=28068 RepID=UPI0002F29D34|nr:ATP-binding protein [Rubrivivax gelatinosus]MBG6082875.1 serine/threonine-protein kinase RsbT [Rubrivivax gelatinosus]